MVFLSRHKGLKQNYSECLILYFNTVIWIVSVTDSVIIYIFDAFLVFYSTESYLQVCKICYTWDWQFYLQYWWSVYMFRGRFRGGSGVQVQPANPLPPTPTPMTKKYHFHEWEILDKFDKFGTPSFLLLLLNKSILLPADVCKIAGWVANSIDPDQLPRSGMSDLDLYCLLRSICPNMWNKYGNMIIKSNPSEILLDPPLMFILYSLHMASCLHMYSISNVHIIFLSCFHYVLSL